MSTELRWYCLEGIEGQTSKAVLTLAGAGFEVWRPFVVLRAAQRRAQNNRLTQKALPPRKDRSYPRFGRYFFLRCDLTPSLYHEIKHASNIRGWLCARGSQKPFPIADHQISWLQDPGNVPEKPLAWEASFKPGQWVTIGPEYPLWAGLRGQIDAIDARGLLKISLRANGSPIPLVIEIGHVLEAAELAKSPNASNDNRARPETIRGPGA